MTPRCLRCAAVLAVAGCALQAEPQPVPAAGAGTLGAPTVSTAQPAPTPGRTLYRCDTGEAVVVQEEQDTVIVSGLPRGEERLGRDAGGLTPRQAVFSGPTLRAEFGLGADGREMALQSFHPPGVLHCRQA